MKKIMLLASALLLACSAMAQPAVVKDALKNISPSSKPEQLKAILASLQPAMTNPETANDAATWYAAGKASLSLYDAYEVAVQIKKEQVDSKEMCQALSDGTKYLEKALKLDTVPEVNKDGTPKIDKKTGLQKVNTKYSKDIVALLDGHVSSYASAGNTCLSAENWDGVETFFGAFAEKAKKVNPNYPDSALAEIRFFEGYGAYQSKHYDNAYKAFTKAIKLGYTANQVSEFQYACLGTSVQACMDANNMDGAEKLVEDAITSEPNNPKFQNLMGIFLERKTGNLEMALPFFKKAIELKPDYSDAQFNVGRYYYNQAAEVVKNNPDLMGDKLLEKTKPFYTEALVYLEKAYQLDSNNNDAKNALRNIYYQLGDQAKFEELSK